MPRTRIARDVANLRPVGAVTGDTIIAAPGANSWILVHSIQATKAEEGTIVIFAGTDADGNRLVDIYNGDNGGIAQHFDVDLALNVALKITTTGTGDAKVVVVYSIVDR